MSAVFTTTGQSLATALATVQPEYDSDDVLVAVWIKRDSGAASGPRHALDLSCGYTSSGGRRLGLVVQAGPSFSLHGGWGDSQAARSAGSVLEDDWQLIAARMTRNVSSPSPNWNFWNGSAVGSSNAAAGGFNADATDDLKILTLGNRAYNSTNQTNWVGKIAEASIFVVADMTEANAIVAELLEKPADQVTTKAPIWYRPLLADTSGGTGAALTNNGSVTFDALDHPALGSVDAAPEFVTTALPDGAAGIPYNELIEVSGHPAPDATVIAGELPPWATLDDSGQPWAIDGSPTPGNWTFTLRAENSEGTDDQEFTITVPNPGGGGGELPEVTTVTLVPASASVEIADTVDLTVTVEDQDGDPVSGLAGTVSSTAPGVATAAQLAPTDADGQAVIRVTGVAAGSASITATFDGIESNAAAMTVTGASVAPTITSTSPLPAATVGVPYSHQLTATGTEPITWTGTAPTGFSLSASGLLTGTASAAGSTSFEATATNAAGSDSETFTLPITETVRPPAVRPLPPSESPVTLTGTGIPGAVIDLWIRGVLYPSAATVGLVGAWSFVFTGDPGTYGVQARQTVGGDTSEWSVPVQLMIKGDEGDVTAGWFQAPRRKKPATDEPRARRSTPPAPPSRVTRQNGRQTAPRDVVTEMAAMANRGSGMSALSGALNDVLRETSEASSRETQLIRRLLGR